MDHSKRAKGKISRRTFLQSASSVVGGAAVGSMMTLASAAQSAEAASGGVSLTVLDPSGANAITNLFTARLPDLNGKVVAELGADPTKWQPHRTFPYIEELLKKRFPTVKFIPMTEFPMGTQINNDKVVAMVKQRGADAAIIGNAG
jgi:hypothetical protein